MSYDQNKLLDNSNEQLSLRSCLRELISNVKCKKIQIATGYWDLPGTNNFETIRSGITDILSRVGTKPAGRG